MRPIFIGGCDRSGTTLLGSLLGGAPGAVTTPESQFKAKVLRELAWPDAPAPQPIAEALETIQSHDRFRTWNTEVPATLLHGRNAPVTLRELLEQIVTCYAQQNAQQSNPAIWVDHDPQNFRIFDELQHHFPDARFVHIVRDGRAVAASLFPLDWGPNTILKAARFWQTNVQLGLDAEAQHPDCVFRVSYEAIVRQPKETLVRLCNQLDLDFTEAMVEGGQFAVPSYTQGQHALVGRPPDAGRINAWQQNLSPREIELFEAEASTLLSSLEYELTAESPRPATRGERARLLLSELVQKQIKRRRFKRRVATQKAT